jgi:hypothetical protein
LLFRGRHAIKKVDRLGCHVRRLLPLWCLSRTRWTPVCFTAVFQVHYGTMGCGVSSRAPPFKPLNLTSLPQSPKDESVQFSV